MSSEPNRAASGLSPFLDRWLSLAGWLGIAGGISVCLLGFSAFVAPGFWFADNMSFFLRQFLGAGVFGFFGGAAGLIARHRLPLLYRKLLTVLLVMLITFGGLMMARIDALTQAPSEGESHPAGKAVRIVSINLEHLPLTDGTLVSFLEDVRPDVLVLQEVAWQWQRRDAAIRSIAGTGPYPDNLVETDLGDIVVFSDLPVLRTDHVVSGDQTGLRKDLREIVSLKLDLGGTALDLTTVHPDSPRSLDRWQRRQDYLAALDTEVQRLSNEDGAAQVVIGDWNLSPWSGHFLSFLERNGLSTGFPNGMPQTTRFFYDYRLHWLLGAVVDHVAVSDEVRIAQVELGPDIGSDHLPLIVDLMIPETQDAD